MSTISHNTKLQLLLMMVLLIITATSYGTDFGVVGQTFRVVEESFIAMLKKRLERVDITKIEHQIKTRVKEHVNNPMPVNGISQAIKDRVFYFDPSYTLDQDAMLPCGKILYKAGTKVNPLEHMDLNRRLLFIDGRQKEQIAWLKEQLNISVPQQEQKTLIEDRVVLVGGSIFRIKEQLGRQYENKVYFDQAGELTNRFGIKASPAIVEQEDKMLRIKEVNISK